MIATYETLLDALFHTAVDGMIIIDQRGIMQLVNPAVLQLFGYPKEELIGKNVSLLMPASEAMRHDSYINNYTQSGQKRIIGIGREVWGLRKDGTMFPFRLAVSEVINVGNMRLFAGIIHDITKQKEAEQEIIQLNAKLEARIHERTEKLAQVVNQLLTTNQSLQSEIAERKAAEAALLKSQQEVEKALQAERELGELKSRFVSTASHEFRTPLSTILSSTALIDRYAQKSDTYPQQLKHIQRVKLAVSNLTGILNDFLSLSRLEEGKIQAKNCQVNACELLNEVVEEMEVYAKSNQHIVCQQQFDSDDCSVELDPHFLKNILINLISNALKYSDDGKNVYLSAQLDEYSLYVSVRDEGIGIAESEQEHLFERFFRAQNATNIQGTGLGLNIVQRYVQLLNGSIHFTSQLGSGTTFYLQIPRTPSSPSCKSDT